MKYLIYILSLFGLYSSMNSQVVVVCHSSVAHDSISTDKLVDLFTLNKNNWDDGARVTIIDQKGSVKSKNSFYERIDIDQRSVKKIRLKKLFTGSAKPPKTVNSDIEVLEMVGKTPGAVGYIDSKNLDTSLSNIKVVAVLDL